jgi:glycosyltransferase involved in cell wall biosynthesis
MAVQNTIGTHLEIPAGIREQIVVVRMAMNRRKAVVILVPGFPATETETHWVPPVQSFVKAITRRNPELAVHVVSFQYPFRRSRYVWHGATIHGLRGRNRRFPYRFRTWIQAAIEIRRLIRTHDVIVIHSFWLAECAYVGSWVARLSGIKHIGYIQGQDALLGNPYLKHLPLNKMTIVALSEKAADAFRGSTGRAVDQIIPIGLDADARGSLVEPAKRSIDILGVGWLSPIKRFPQFLDLIYRLKTDFPALNCMIVGDGPGRAGLEHQIRQNALEANVRLAGQLPREEVLSRMRNAKILLHTSYYEGQGYVFLEALASGMRVVSFDVGYAPKSANVYRCQSYGEMLGALRTLLAAPLQAQEIEVPNIDETANAFEKLYGLN